MSELGQSEDEFYRKRKKKANITRSNSSGRNSDALHALLAVAAAATPVP